MPLQVEPKEWAESDRMMIRPNLAWISPGLKQMTLAFGDLDELGRVRHDAGDVHRDDGFGPRRDFRRHIVIVDQSCL